MPSPLLHSILSPFLRMLLLLAMMRADSEENIKSNDEYSFSFTTANPGADINESIFPLSTDTWYERQNTDDGSFDQTLDMTFPLDGVYTNSSLSGVFGTALMDSIGNSTTPITIDGLPAGLSLNLTKTSTGIRLNLTGNAIAHAKRIDNTSFDITFLSNFFQTSELYTSADISFSFDIVFGGKRWSSRYGHQSFVYNDKIWVLGGYDGGNTKNDIWTSDDEGATWNQVSVTGTHWSSRAGHQSFVYNDKIWILGGYDGSYKNDIWTSDDEGATWNQVSVMGTHWSTRTKHQSFVYDDKIWVLGGEINDNLDDVNDIWASADGGINWTPISVAGTHWSGRSGHQSFVYNNKMWILGGLESGLNEAEGWSYIYTNDIWPSHDSGTNWNQVSPSEPYWSGRNDYQSFIYNNKMWILGGYADYTDDIWNSRDSGTNWTSVPVVGTDWSARFGHRSFVYNDKIWVLGGYDGNNNQNDIWTSADGGVTWQEIIQEFY